MKEELRAFITGELMHMPKYKLGDDEPIITGGLIDSFSLVQVGLFIEEKFGVHFDDSELTVANMNTLNQMIDNIQAKQ